ncbi:MAG: hypothetical protein LBL57_09965, partial [Tannerella sp.]|nr:hypothetical protein [Tannerella sp.]
SVATFLEQKNYRWDHLIIIPGYNKEDYDPGIQVYPATFLTDKKGIVQDVFGGGRLRQIIASLEVLDRIFSTQINKERDDKERK